jgi:hypothetical protein
MSTAHADGTTPDEAVQADETADAMKSQLAKDVAAEVKPASSEKKPFGMSYDGTSRADYIKLMISRGAR